MNQDDVIRMAREAGAGEPESLFGRTDYIVMTHHELERFAALAFAAGAAHEREECAKLVENYWDSTDWADKIASDIRARGQA